MKVFSSLKTDSIKGIVGSERDRIGGKIDEQIIPFNSRILFQ